MKTKPIAPLTLTLSLLMLSSLACVTITGALGLDPSPTLTETAAPETPDTATPVPDDSTGDGRPDPSEEPRRDNQDYEGDYDEDGRPILSGETLLFDTARFRIHYTSSGDDAVPDGDVNQNQVPDYVEQIAEAVEFSWESQIIRMGWAAPPPDQGLGGDDRYDIYLENILWDGTAGYTDGGYDEQIVGDNPNTPEIETQASHSFISLDNDYQEVDTWGELPYTKMDYMRSTATHEFNHAIQFGYDSQEPADWLWEATATWIQDEVYDHINDGDEFLESVFKSPDTCQIAYGGEERLEDDGHWYGMWIFLRYISEQHGPQTVRAMWEHARQLDGYAILDAALGGAGVTLEETFQGFTLALLTRGFEEGTNYPTVRLEGEAQSGQTFTPDDGVGQMAADFVEIIANGPVTVSLDSPDLIGLLVGVQGGQIIVFNMPGNQAAADADAFDRLYLIVINLERTDYEYKCRFSDYTASVQPGGTPPSPAYTLAAPNFSAPGVEGISGGYGGGLEPPAELMPAYLPEGYYYVEAYEMEREEFGEYADWFVPGDGPALVVDFYGPGDPDYIDMTISDSPFQTLDEFFTFVDYEPLPGELQTLAGVEVFIEDYGDSEGPFSYATFIWQGYFVVVSGTIPVDEISLVVESIFDSQSYAVGLPAVLIPAYLPKLKTPIH